MSIYGSLKIGLDPHAANINGKLVSKLERGNKKRNLKEDLVMSLLINKDLLLREEGLEEVNTGWVVEN